MLKKFSQREMTHTEVLPNLFKYIFQAKYIPSIIQYRFDIIIFPQEKHMICIIINNLQHLIKVRFNQKKKIERKSTALKILTLTLIS